MEHLYLQGSEDVQRAGNTIAIAAENMRRAANTLEETLSQQQRFMDDWLLRFECLLREFKP